MDNQRAILHRGLCALICGTFAFVSVAATKPAPPKAGISHTIAVSAPLGATQARIGLKVADLKQVGLNQSAAIDLAGLGKVNLVGSSAETLPSGNVAWRGSLPAFGPEYGASLILASTGIIGDIRTPAGRYHLEPAADGSQVATFFDATTYSSDACAPAQAPAAAKLPPQQAAAPAPIDAQLNAGLARTDRAQVDVLFVYSASVESQYGARLPALLDSLLLTANTATAQSGVALRFALAGSMKVSPRNMVAGDLQAALVAVTSSEDSSLPRNADFIGVAAKRQAVGADLVVLLVSRIDYTVGCVGAGGCMVGTAWQATRESLSSDYPGLHSYAIADISATDLALTVTHEMGHLLGAGHDYLSGGDGLFADSKGFRSADGTRGDLMSYAPQPALLFSNPNVICDGAPCGAATGTAAPSDNARALNATRFIVADFRQSVAATPDLAGLWSSGPTSGQQLQLSRSGKTWTALWFTHDGSGQPVWYVASGCQLIEAQCSADLYVSWTYQPGILNGAVLDPGQVMAAKVGSIALDAGNPGTLAVSVTIHGENVQISLARQFISAEGAAAQPAHDGSWWISTGLESGVVVAQHGNTLYLAWFSYGSDGRGNWYVVPDCQIDSTGTACQGEMYQTGNPAGNGAIAVAPQRLGTAGLTFLSANAATFRWQTNGAWSVSQIEREMTLE
ncbi:MAG: hypothetical protein HY255_02135 [Betaproteobacteria bacterium]|nr:hypothetical protein [Betaproteobacteria bacterium]